VVIAAMVALLSLVTPLSEKAPRVKRECGVYPCIR
jgi:hypothetical protein